MAIINRQGFKSVAFPLIGAGTGGKKKKAREFLLDELANIETEARLVVVDYSG